MCWKKNRKTQQLFTMTALLILSLLFSGCAGGAASQAPKEIVIGASVPQSGVLAAFGSYATWGYNTAVNEINEKGGVQLSKYNTRVPVRLILYDDESRPEKVTENTERLILKDNVDVLLGSATPPLTISGGVVAEREKVPQVSASTPIRAFLGASDTWTWVHVMFFDELQMTQSQFQTMDMVESNRKVALFTDNEQDGVVMGGLWEENAPKFGYEVVYHANFPVGTTEYGDLIRRAQEADAEIVIAQMITPDSIALWRQMTTLGYKPKAAFFEKGGEPVEWWAALGDLAQGTMVAGYWHPSLGYPGAADLRTRFEADTGQMYSQHIADMYSAAWVMLDAIEKAGSLDREAINKAIGETDKTYAVGHIKFTEGPTKAAAALPITMLQWQSGELEIVWPEDLATKSLIYPIP
jgi:branched-chain amino acid transport system substrate-binding protein